MHVSINRDAEKHSCQFIVCFTHSTLDSSLLSNIQKLFYERIEVFGTVDFYKLSIVTGIIKIFLKVCVCCVCVCVCVCVVCVRACVCVSVCVVCVRVCH